MDEILIEEKRYISSKQAAKITGYAKDYVGQLCREGRVPARLVGRSWYVLESAIKDHRFGDPIIDQKETIKTTPQTDTPFPSQAFPRYESSPVEVLPTLNRLEDRESLEQDEKMTPETSQNLHDSWKEWFDHISNTSPVVEEPVESIEPEENEEEYVPISHLTEEKEAQPHENEFEEEVPVPLRTFSHHLPQREFLPRDLSIEPAERRELEAEEEVVQVRIHRTESRIVVRVLKTIGILLAAVALIFAVIGSGYFDTYLVSNNQATFISGLSVYNK